MEGGPDAVRCFHDLVNAMVKLVFMHRVASDGRDTNMMTHVMAIESIITYVRHRWARRWEEISIEITYDENNIDKLRAIVSTLDNLLPGMKWNIAECGDGYEIRYTELYHIVDRDPRRSHPHYVSICDKIFGASANETDFR